MAYEYTPLVMPFLAGLLVLVFLAYFLYRLSGGRLRLALLLWTCGGAAWCVSSAMKISATTGGEYAFWQNLRYLGPPIVSVAFFLVAAAYTNRDRWFQWHYLAGLFVVPLLTNIYVWTNSYHELMRAPIEPGANAFPVVSVVQGPWFWVHATYSYAIIIIGFGWLVAEFLRSHRSEIYQVQIALILIGAIIPLVPSALYNADITLIDWTPAAESVSALLVTVALFRYRLLDISPIARDMVVETIDNGLLVVDTESRVVDANDRASEVFNVERQDLIGQSLSEVTSDYPELRRAIDETRENSNTVSLKRDGERSYYDVDISPISDNTGTDVGRVIIFNDVTTKVERERELERQNERLDQFTSMVSHDLRNPLSIARTYLDFAEETGDEEDFEAVRGAHKRMNAMIEDLMTMARAGETVEETEVVNLTEVVNEGWENAQMDGANLELEISRNRTVEAERDYLLHVFENLFRNAVDHNETPLTVRVGTLEREERMGDSRGFFVEDDGEGIPEDKREKVFEYGHTTSDEGTGFGLSIVQEMVEAHGWDISVGDGENGGARFEIWTG